MNWRTMFRGLFAWSTLGVIFLFVIYPGGFSGFIPFMNLEALFIVMVGTSLMLWVSYPARDIPARGWNRSVRS